ncbi:MAG TPA: hypothetical protein VNH11_11265 [Pirellulales bacterium]|nr:hypothetical protein [Pirellulales bacterium]
MAKNPLTVSGIHLPSSLEELARMANSEFSRAERNARNAVEPIVRAGAALVRAREMCDDAAFERFLEGFHGSQRSAQIYMRLALHWELLKARAPAQALTSQRSAIKALSCILSGGQAATANDATPPKTAKPPKAQRAARPAPADGGPVIERSRATGALQDAMATLQSVLDELRGIPVPNSHLSFIYGRVREAHARLGQVVRQVAGQTAPQIIDVSAAGPQAAERS